MKELKVNEALLNFDGSSIMDERSGAAIAKSFLLGALSAYPGSDQKNKFLAYDLGIRLAKTKEDSVLLEGAEYAVLLESVRANPLKFFNLVHVQVLRLVEGAKDVEVEKKEER